jgi:hypothetical protein
VPAEVDPEIAFVLENRSDETIRVRFEGPAFSGASLAAETGFLRLDLRRASYTGRETTVGESWVVRVPLDPARTGGEDWTLRARETARVPLRFRLDRGGGFLLQHYRLSGAFHPAAIEWGGDPTPILFLPLEGCEVRFYPAGFEAIEGDPLGTMRRALGLSGAGRHVFVAATLLPEVLRSEGAAAIAAALPSLAGEDAEFARGAASYLAGDGDGDEFERLRRELTGPPAPSRVEKEGRGEASADPGGA